MLQFNHSAVIYPLEKHTFIMDISKHLWADACRETVGGVDFGRFRSVSSNRVSNLDRNSISLIRSRAASPLLSPAISDSINTMTIF